MIPFSIGTLLCERLGRVYAFMSSGCPFPTLSLPASYPSSSEWEQKLWALRDDPDGKKAFLDSEPKCVSALPKMIVQGYKELVRTSLPPRASCALSLPAPHR